MSALPRPCLQTAGSTPDSLGAHGNRISDYGLLLSIGLNNPGPGSSASKNGRISCSAGRTPRHETRPGTWKKLKQLTHHAARLSTEGFQFYLTAANGTPRRKLTCHCRQTRQLGCNYSPVCEIGPPCRSGTA
ncbi:hypothetical protein AG1IA_09988 [Rhizoctonia solani AG-1 IA]|uniref:Uncharacterized protein n=1 Tax=Thanatephorus cucumeris (strain AG1-IA) TaxID=983506 RepID=L8WGX7_THACA|nr:hypothetical protein AG1IA_09988 [Rhizoctonia solani AG-1 IA]